MANLQLFIKRTCPYCAKVRSFMAHNNISIPVKDISSSPEAREELIRVGGKQQVPCLFIDGSALYESHDIIEYLQKEYVS